MQTQGSVVTDVFHGKYLLQRTRGDTALTGLERIDRVSLYEKEAERKPNFANLNALVCEEISLMGCIYEDARQALLDGVPRATAEQGLPLAGQFFNRAHAHADMVERDPLHSPTSLSALRAGISYNVIVLTLEWNQDQTQGRQYLDMTLADLEKSMAKESAMLRGGDVRPNQLFCTIRPLLQDLRDSFQ